MAERPPPRSARRRGRWRRTALPRSRGALALGALVAALLLVLLLIGTTRARSGRDVPAYDPSATTTTTVPGGPVRPPVITAVATVAVPVPAPAPSRRGTATTARHR